MNYAAMMLGAVGLLAVATIYYVFLRKRPDNPAGPASPEQP